MTALTSKTTQEPLSTATKFDDVKDQTTADYFEGNQFSIDAFEKKYRENEKETYVEAIWRVCQSIASVEETEALRIYWAERWFDEIYNDWWHPAGSIMQGAGSSRKISLANCTTISLGTRREHEAWDSLESIVRNTEYTVAKCAAYRQGLGVDFSRLRPKTMSVNNSSNESLGAVHWMKKIDSNGYYVGQKGRIPAMLFSLRVDHPDIEEFIGVKADYTKIQNANISVQCTDAFYEAVEKDEDWVLHFEIPETNVGDKIYIPKYSIVDFESAHKNGQGYFVIAERARKGETFTKKVRARKLLELIAKNMTDHAEPGIQNVDTAIRLSNSDYVYNPEHPIDSRIVSTNACSEQFLNIEGLCVLSSINAGKFSTDDPNLRAELDKIGHSINRFLDNVNEYELRNHTYATPNQKLSIEYLRRTGAGFTNLVGWLAKQGLDYGTQSANEAAGEFQKIYNYYLYKSSIGLGLEKGSFKAFNREALEQSPFIQGMMDEGLEFEALRNITVSSIAPVGTLSLMFRGMVCSYGIEPAFGPYYWKRTRIAGRYDYYFCVPRIVRDAFSAIGKPLPMKSDTLKDDWSGSAGKSIAQLIDEGLAETGLVVNRSTDVTPLAKLDLMGRVASWVDSSISTTYMLPEDSDWRDTYDFILKAHSAGVKSVAAFPDRKMYGIISYVPFKSLAEKLIEEKVDIHSQNFSEEERKVLKLKKEVRQTTVIRPRRPESLPCDVHQVSVQGQRWVVLIGMLDDKPYEIFGGLAEYVQIPKKLTTGILLKRPCEKDERSGSENCYDLYTGDEDDPLVVKNVSMVFQNKDFALATRLASVSLGHGIPIETLIDQLKKDPGSTIVSFSRVLSRVLSKYIVDEVTGEPVEDGGCRSGKCE